MALQRNGYLTFFLDTQGYAVPIVSIASVLRAVEITHLPKALEYVCGIINMYGQIVPVLDIRRILGKKERILTKNDVFIVVKEKKQCLVLWVDELGDMVENTRKEMTENNDIFSHLDYIDGAIKYNNCIFLIPDLKRLSGQINGLELT